MKKYFAFLFSFLFILVSVFSFSSFGSVHAQEFTKTVQFTKFPLSVKTKDNYDNIRDYTFSTTSNSVRYSLAFTGKYFDILFFSSTSFNINESQIVNDTDPMLRTYHADSNSRFPNVYIYHIRFIKDDLFSPSIESLTGKTVSFVNDGSTDSYFEYAQYALGQDVKPDHGIDSPSGPSTHVSDLGSLQLLDSNPWSWANVKTGNQVTKQTFVARFKPDTTTGKVIHKDFDGYQVMVEAKDVKYVNNFTNGVSDFPDGITLQNGKSYKKILPDIQGVQMPLISVEYPDKFYKDVFSSYGVKWTNESNNNLGIAHRISFKCVFYARPVKGDTYGDWLRIETDRNITGGSDGTFQTGTSSDDPTSTDFTNPSDISSGKGSTGTGDTVDSALDNASSTYNPFKGDTIWSDDWKTNFENLVSPLVAIPNVIRSLFSWLPSWVLTMFAVAFGSIPIIIIYKLLRG